MDSTHAPVEMLIYVWKVLSLPFASVPLTWLSLFLFIFPVEGEDFCYVTNFANPRHIRVLYLEFSDFLYFLICSIFSLRFEIQRLIPPSLVRWQKENCASCSLIQKAVGIVFFFWNTFFFCRYFPVTWQWTMLGMFGIPSICTKGVASFRVVLHSTALVWETFCMRGLLRRLQAGKKRTWLN